MIYNQTVGGRGKARGCFVFPNVALSDCMVFHRLIAVAMILAVVPGPSLCCCASRAAFASWIASEGATIPGCGKCWTNRKSAATPSSTRSCCYRFEDVLPIDRREDGHEWVSIGENIGETAPCQCEHHRTTKYQQVSKPVVESLSFPTVNQLDSWQLQYLYSSCYSLELHATRSNDGIPDDQSPPPLSGCDLLRAYQILRC